MKRFFLSVFLGFTTVYGAAAQQNTNTFTWQATHVFRVPNDPPPTIDAVNFVISPGALFGVDLTAEQVENNFPFTTSDTLNVTNYGRLSGVPGFDFEYFPTVPPPPQPGVPFTHMAGTFANLANGLGGGAIYCTNIDFGVNPFELFGVGSDGLLPFIIPGLAACHISATNVIDSGLITMDDTGLIDIKGNDLDLRRGQFLMSNSSSLFGGLFGFSTIDFGLGVIGSDTNLVAWDPGTDLGPASASSAEFLSDFTGLFEQMILTSPTVYWESNVVSSNLVVWRAIYLQDSSPANVAKTVYFGGPADPFDPDLGGRAFHIEWAGTYRDPVTGNQNTNYLYLSDEPVLDRSTNTLFYAFRPNRIPSEFSITERAAKAGFLNPPATPGFANPAPAGVFITNSFAYISVRPTAAPVDTNLVFGGSVTNIPGRIQFTANNSLNLANTHISGPNYLSLTCTNDFRGNTNAVISSAYADLNLGVTSGFLNLSNLLLPSLPAWTGVTNAPSAVFEGGSAGFPTEMGGLQAWSGTFMFVDTNGVTNDVRVLLVNSALQPTARVLEQNVNLHATQQLTVSDDLNIFGNFTSDTTSLTVTTNDLRAFSVEGGEINLLSPDIFWSSSLPNLQNLTNYNFITTQNLTVFAGNYSNPYMDPNSATPYQSFVNYGTIIDRGTLIRANWFQNDGLLSETFDGSIDIGAGTVIATNGVFSAPLGAVSITAGSVLANNGSIVAGSTLTLGGSCFISDGDAFGNQFGLITNALLPNVVTNGNTWVVNGGVQIATAPASGDLLGTTIIDGAVSNLNSYNVWPAQDRGASPSGFANNLALGRLILNADDSGSQFDFVPANGNNAIYVDSLELQGNTTNTDANGNPLSIAIAPGMKIYYAQAIENGVSVAEKLNGKYGSGSVNGGQFYWVSNYAGVYSSTNIPYPDGNTYIFNEALAVSPDLDSDGDGTVNKNDQTPIPIGWVFPVTNNGPVSCDGGQDGGNTGTGSVGNPPSGGGTVQTPGTLAFPAQSADSSAISFSLAQGSYNGLFYDTNGVNPASSGFFTAKVTSKGGLSAKLQLGGHTYSFSKPPFDSTGHFSGSVSGKKLPALNVDLQLVGNDQIVGTVSGNGWIAQLQAERAAFSSKNKAPWAGKDTLLLSTVDTNSTTPAGDSFGTVNISPSGSVQWSGMLPDGAKVTQKSALSKGGIWPLYCAPYGGAGTFIGWMQCTNGPDITGSGVWVAPAGATGLYPAGLTNQLDATGSGTIGSLGAHSQMTAVLSGGSLSASITNNITVLGKMNQNADGTLKLSVNVKSGLFSGSVTDSNSSQQFSFEGAFLEKSGVGGGFFLNANGDQGGKFCLTPAN